MSLSTTEHRLMRKPALHGPSTWVDVMSMLYFRRNGLMLISAFPSVQPIKKGKTSTMGFCMNIVLEMRLPT